MDESYDDEYYRYCFGELPSRAFASRSRVTANGRKRSSETVATPSARRLALRRWPPEPLHEAVAGA